MHAYYARHKRMTGVCCYPPRKGPSLKAPSSLTDNRMAVVTSRKLTDEDIFSDTYLDAFYRAHVASRRGNLDEDIAAIEAEIRK